MPKSHRPYSPEFRQRIIELVRKGRTFEELGRQFEPRPGDPELGEAGGPRCRAAPRRAHDGGAGGTAPPAPGESRAPGRAGDPEKSRGLVCAGDYLDPIQGFEFVTAHQAVHHTAPNCTSRPAS